MVDKIACIKCGTKILPTTFAKYNGLCATCDRKKCEHEAYQKFITTPGCPICDGQGYLSFYWNNNIKENNDKLNKYKKYIKKVMFLKQGELFQCNLCDTYWFLENKQMNLVENIDNLKKWNESKHILPFNLFLKLLWIRSNPVDRYGNNSNFSATPCSIITKDNLYYENVLILLTDSPPLRKDDSRSLVIDIINNIKKSPNTLPIAVRKAIADTPEVSMGFRPIIICSKDKRIFRLNGSNGFFKYNEIRGNEMSLPVPFHKTHNSKIIDYEGINDEILCIYGEMTWFQKVIYRIWNRKGKSQYLTLSTRRL